VAVVEDGDGLCVGRYSNLVRFNMESLNDKDLSVLLITVVISNSHTAQTRNLEANKNNDLPGARSL
jgi:phosphotransferase system IIA component